MMKALLLFFTLSVVWISIGHAQQGEELLRAGVSFVETFEAIEIQCRESYKSTAEDVDITTKGLMKMKRYPENGFLIHTLSDNGWEGMVSPDTMLLINPDSPIAMLWLRSNSVAANPELDFLSTLRLTLAPEMLTNIVARAGGPPALLQRVLEELHGEEAPEVTLRDADSLWTIVITDSASQFKNEGDKYVEVTIPYTRTIIIRKSDNLPVFTEYRSTDGKELFIESFEITGASFEPEMISIAERLTQLPDGYDTKVVPPENHVPLELGTPIEWAGRYLDGDTVSSEDFKGRFTLYKFTYRACSICHEFIPFMKHLQKRFQELTVVELDPYDRGDEDKMRKYISKNEIEYPFIFISRDDPKRLNIYGFPTFYLVDPYGKLVWQDGGEADPEQMVKEIGSRIE